MIKHRDWVFADLGVSTDQAIEAFKALGQSLEQYKINDALLKQLETSSKVTVLNDQPNVEFITQEDTVTKLREQINELEIRVAKLEETISELRTNAIERTENPNQKGDLEIFDQKDETEDDNIFNINADMFQIGTAVNWNNIQGWSLDTKKDMEEYNFGTIYK